MILITAFKLDMTKLLCAERLVRRRTNIVWIRRVQVKPMSWIFWKKEKTLGGRILNWIAWLVMLQMNLGQRRDCWQAWWTRWVSLMIYFSIWGIFQDTGQGLKGVDSITERYNLRVVYGPLYRLFKVIDPKFNIAIELTAGNGSSTCSNYLSLTCFQLIPCRSRHRRNSFQGAWCNA